MKILYYKIRMHFFQLLSYVISHNSGVFTCIINGKSKFSKSTQFGTNVNFNGCSVYGFGNVKFGNNFHSAKGLKILTTIHNYKGSSLPYDRSIINKDVIFEDNVWVGMDVMILGGVIIGEGAIIQAGSVVVSNVPKLAIVGGNPAREFSARDEKHYYSLKKEGKFM